MKTGENELHEAIIDVFKSTSGAIAIETHCDVCGRLLYDTGWCQYVPEEVLTRRAKGVTPNYCPNCGARLKEIKDEQ